MTNSRIFLAFLAIGFLSSMTANVEGQLFRRAMNNGCCGQVVNTCYQPAPRCCQPRVVRMARQGCCQNQRIFYQQPVMNAQPAMPMGNGCGCSGTTMMSNSVMNGNTVTGFNGDTFQSDDERIKFGAQMNESCQSTFDTCMRQCQQHCQEDLATCEAHCKCNRDICEPSIKTNCNKPRADCQPVQPDPRSANR